jgi:hypothetical protein
MASDHIRASDRDRDAVVGTLRDAYTDGRLTLEEFQERTAAAYGGRTWGDLKELTTDLPLQPALGTDLPPEAQPAGTAPSAPQPPGQQPGALPPGFPWGYPPAGMPLGQQSPGVQPHSGPQPPETQSRQPRPRPFAPVIPVVGIWILFALATRSAGGAIAFIIAVALLVTLATVGRRRPPRGPSDRRRD